MNIFYIVIKTKDNIVIQIDNECKDTYIKKLEVSNIISERLGIKGQKFELKENSYLRDLNIFLPNFLKMLWEDPIVVSKLLINSDILDVKNNLASFFVNNFYENILSSYYIEDNLIYVLILLLKNEINNLNNCNNHDNFLNDNSPCKYLLSELRKKSDVKNFFKSIIYDVVENLELKNSETIINFNIGQIQKEIKLNLEKYKKKLPKNKPKHEESIGNNILLERVNSNVGFNSECLERVGTLNMDNPFIRRSKTFLKPGIESEIFNSKYLSDLPENDLENKLNEYKDNPNMKEYIRRQIAKCKNDKKIFSNKIFIDSLYKSEHTEKIYDAYQNDFLKIIKYIDEILENIKNKIHLLPYSLKCVCKIISILLSKKFPDITTTEKNSFIGVFFFKIIFSPIFQNPTIEALINNLIISRNSLKNFHIISDIINQLVSGHFFTNKDFIPFNRYFIEKMPFIYDLFEQLTNIALSPFVEKLLNDEIDENYKYNYFEENEDEVMFHISFCYTLDDITSLIKNMNKIKNILSKEEKYKALLITLQKIDSNQKLIETLKNHDDYEMVKEIKNPKSKKKEYVEVKKRKKLYYFLNSELIWNDNYKKLFSNNQKTNSFALKELNNMQTEEDILKNNVIKVKNYFSCLLCNYRKIKKIDFNMMNILNFENILKELKIFMNSSNFVIDSSIPSEWYVDILFEYIKKIPDFYKENDYENLFLELENDINKSIKEFDFEGLSVCMDKIKFIKRWKKNLEGEKESILDIQQNEKTKQIIENEIIPVEIKFAYNNSERYFSITKAKKNKLKFLDDMVYENNKINSVLCPTIESFTKLFPSLNDFEIINISPFNIMKELNIPEHLLNYFKSTKIYLTKTQNNLNSNEIENISNKIYDYIMNKLYKKIFPSSPNEKDKEIYKNCILLSWTEPKHFMKEIKKNYVYDTFLPDVVKYIKLIEIEKSPRKKILNLCNVFKTISNLDIFNGGKGSEGVDDTILILSYAIIKSRPIQIYKNSKYIELFLGDKNEKIEGNYLAQLLSVSKFIEKINYEKLYNVNKEEYDKKCEKLKNYLNEKMKEVFGTQNYLY